VAGLYYVTGTTWFQVRDNRAADLYDGIYDQDWHPKPAYYSILQRTRAG
jgi:hypothetical protein